MAYDLPKERKELEQEPLSYDKIKWPSHYKDIIFKRKNIITLPVQAKQVPKLVGLKRATGVAAGMDEVSAKGPDGKVDMREIDRIAAEMNDKVNATVSFDASFECANLE